MELLIDESQKVDKLIHRKLDVLRFASVWQLCSRIKILSLNGLRATRYLIQHFGSC